MILGMRWVMNVRYEYKVFQVKVSELFSFMYSMAVIRASYFMLNVSFWSKNNSYSYTLSTRTLYSCRPLAFSYFW